MSDSSGKVKKPLIIDAKLHRSSHFAPAFLFLKKDRRRALELLYAVCRVLDDAVDEPHPDPKGFLEAWRRVFSEKESHFVAPFGQQELAQSFLEQAARYQIPLSVMGELIDKGVALDLEKNRFQTPMDTESYCYGVASTVGIACLPLFGVPIEEGRLFAVRLGVAIQWTNLIRDVGADAKLGRIYLPLDHLEQFGYTEADLFEAKNNSQFQSLLQYETDVALGHYKRAEELLPLKWKKELLPARIMGSIYQRLLLKIKNKNYAVFQQKIRLSLGEKAWAVWTTLKH